MRQLFPLALLLLGGGLGSLPAAADPGPGDLLVAPTRVVFAGRDRVAELTLVNLGDAPATYRVSFVELRMDEDGGTAEFASSDAQPGELLSSGLIRYFPRQVRLEAHLAQTLRLQLRPPEGGLPAGEYRSHLLLRAVPEGEEPPAADAPGPAGLAVRLRAIYGVSVPVIVRSGTTAAAAVLTDLQLAPAERPGGPPILSFRIGREGGQSIYGNLAATYHPVKGKALRVGAVDGVAVYTPNTSRRGKLALSFPAGELPRSGRLQLTYAAPDGEILAAEELVLR